MLICRLFFAPFADACHTYFAVNALRCYLHDIMPRAMMKSDAVNASRYATLRYIDAAAAC